MTAPLQGIRVIDWTHVLAGPACAYYLGLLGADVVKVERPGRGDAMRHRGGTDKDRTARGMSTAYCTQGAGKQSLTLDLGTEAGHEVFCRLLKSADVLVENHRPSTLRRLGLSEDQTRAMNPKLIHCAMTGYGRGNEMADAPAYDVNIQAISGLMAMTGTQESGPIRTGAPIVDYATALVGALAVMSGLMRRQATGEGAFVDVSMLETAFSLMSSTITDHLLTGSEPKRRGNAANSRSPSSGTFACKTGHISLGVNEEPQFRALAEALERSGWLTDPRFADPKAREKNRDALSTELSEALATRPAQDWEAVLIANGVPAACLRTLSDALDLSPAKQRNFTQRGAAGSIGLPFAVPGVGRSDVNSRPAPQLGADTNAVLRELGYSEIEIELLRTSGVIGSADCLVGAT